VLLELVQVGFYREEADWLREQNGELRELAVGKDGALAPLPR
jgi:hypothetical protein